MDINEDFIYITIGKKIKEFREKLDITQEELARSIKVSRTSIANFESGKQYIYISDLYKIAINFNVDIVKLLPATKEVESKSSLEARLEEASADLKEDEKTILEGFINKPTKEEGT